MSSKSKESGPAVRIGQGEYERTWPPLRLIHEPADVYHAKSKEHLSSHALRDFRKSPLLFRRKEQGLIADQDSSAYLVGRAAHTLVLEGRERYEAEYAVGGPINEKTGKPYGSATKAFAEWAESQGRAVLNDSNAATVEMMAMSVSQHQIAADLLREGIPEGVIRLNYMDHPCQVRLDWVNPNRGIVDYKTTFDLDGFAADAHAYDYPHQFAFYSNVYTLATSDAMPFWVVATEKKEPFRTGVWQVHRTLLQHAAGENERAMAELHRCRQTGHWPTRYEMVRLLDRVG